MLSTAQLPAFGCTQQFFEVQRDLSKWQAIPVVGPIFISPAKAMFSMVQIVVGFVLSFFMSFGMIMCMSEDAGKLFCDTCTFTAMGMLAFGYSLLNIATFGIAGWRLESGARGQ